MANHGVRPECREVSLHIARWRVNVAAEAGLLRLDPAGHRTAAGTAMMARTMNNQTGIVTSRTV